MALLERLHRRYHGDLRRDPRPILADLGEPRSDR